MAESGHLILIEAQLDEALAMPCESRELLTIKTEVTSRLQLPNLANPIQTSIPRVQQQ